MLMFLLYVGIALAAIGLIPLAILLYQLTRNYVATPLKQSVVSFLENRNKDEVDLEIERIKQENNERKLQKEKLVYLAQLQQEGRLLEQDIVEEIKRQDKEMVEYD